MNLFVGGFPVVSPHGVMASVKPVLVGNANAGFDPHATGLQRSDSWVSLTSLNSDHSANSNELQTQDSLGSVEAIPGPGPPQQFAQPQVYQPYNNMNNSQNNYHQYQQRQRQQQHQNPYNQYQQQQQYNNNNQWNQHNSNQNQRHWNNNQNGNRKTKNNRKQGFDSRGGRNERPGNTNYNNRQQNNSNNYRNRRNRRSKHQPPRFSDPDACKFCRTKRKYLKSRQYTCEEISTLLP